MKMMVIDHHFHEKFKSYNSDNWLDTDRISQALPSCCMHICITFYRRRLTILFLISFKYNQHFKSQEACETSLHFIYMYGSRMRNNRKTGVKSYFAGISTSMAGFMVLLSCTLVGVRFKKNRISLCPHAIFARAPQSKCGQDQERLSLVTHACPDACCSCHLVLAHPSGVNRLTQY